MRWYSYTADSRSITTSSPLNKVNKTVRVARVSLTVFLFPHRMKMEMFERERRLTMNCLCNIFDDCNVWIILIALVIIFCHCN